MKPILLTLMLLFANNCLGQVICPECRKEGKKSTVTQTMSMTTSIWTMISYDENGSLRPTEDPNITTTYYKCSNGHSFEKKYRGGKELGGISFVQPVESDTVRLNLTGTHRTFIGEGPIRMMSERQYETLKKDGMLYGYDHLPPVSISMSSSGDLTLVMGKNSLPLNPDHIPALIEVLTNFQKLRSGK